MSDMAGLSREGVRSNAAGAAEIQSGCKLWQISFGFLALPCAASSVHIPAGFVGHNLPDHGRRFISPWRFAQGNYSVNSAAFHFIPIERMKDEGYEAFLSRLEKK